MRSLEQELRSLNPVEPDAPAPDGEDMLRRILAAPEPPPRRRRRLHALAPAALTVALLAVAVAIAAWPRADDERVVEPAAAGTILHYELHVEMHDETGVPFVEDFEVWQRSDGSRQRRVLHAQQIPDQQELVTRTESLTYVDGDEHIIRYKPGDEDRVHYDDGPPFRGPAAPAAYALPDAIGDPRTLPDRVGQGVTELPAAAIRGVAVRVFAIGDCARAGTRFAYRASLARDSGEPVRVVETPCTEGAPARTFDYRSFEELPATPANERQLELVAPAGTPIVDGVEIDLAEERDENR